MSIDRDAVRVSVRVADQADAEPIAAVFLEARCSSMSYLPALHSDEETRAWIRDGLLRRQEVWVGETDRGVAGFVALERDLLAHLYVVPDGRRRGIGSTLLAHAKQARPAGFRLYVFQRNEQARRFYEARGLRLVELGDGSGNEEREPDALYEWLP